MDFVHKLFNRRLSSQNQSSTKLEGYVRPYDHLSHLNTVIRVGRVRDGRVGGGWAGNPGGVEACAALEATRAVVSVTARNARPVHGVVRVRPRHAAGDAGIPAGPRGDGARRKFGDARARLGQRAVHPVRVGQGLEPARAVGVQAARVAPGALELLQSPPRVREGAVPGRAIVPARGLPDLVILLSLGLVDSGVDFHDGIVQFGFSIAECFLFEGGGLRLYAERVKKHVFCV